MNNMPLLNALKEFVNKETISLHVPGHKNGKHTYIKDLELPNILSYDVTELNGLDDLHYSSEVIYEAQKILAEVYNAEESFFLVNGSTVGNLASILAICNENDEVFVQRNCHKSIFHGLLLAGAKPIFLPLDIDEELGQPLGININQSMNVIKDYPNAKAMILTNPNYYGMSQNLGNIIEFAHSMGIPTIVDEAHGAHFIIGTPFPEDALSMGADIVIQSAHKTLPAMTMGSYLHIKSKLVSKEKIKEMLRMLQSSSPSYPIMASLDYARNFVESFSSDRIIQLQRKIEQFMKGVCELSNLNIVTTGHLNYKQDLLKLIVKSKKGHTGKQLQEIFETEGIYTELSDWGHVLFILPLDEKIDYNDLISRIKKATDSMNFIENKQPKLTVPNFTSTVSYSYAGLKKKRKMVKNLADSVGEISAENIVPYPPGVPILLKGELITTKHVDYIHNIYQYGMTIHNLIENKNLQIEVLI
ncbi:aminotransferase class I/II-fold pyridoxal phosphate-dependent enzyme [Bacillus sp. AFS041924]|uniref:aminotransferase class I/II-fold pyridoxal phosphate-dependent enzyme n=1 Tax=Bacillus sp. AFS041924 TaxID=2033503 RepID=UPI000BFC7C0B|nr:aminotransferase class I/II-fold pyridoxal phosphate-dependent enzyme [Bacillus sp. AFS041924]PGS49516.1 arginine decarboxylase [Bacillus sp. AFS041924]